MAGQCRGEGEEGEEVGGLAVVADVEAVVAGQPGDRALDHPSVVAEALGGFDAFAGDADADAAVSHPFRSSAVSYALSACSLPGLRRRGPRRDRMAGTALTSGRSASASLVLAAEIPTGSGIPARSDRTWIFEPGLPRSTGLGPVKAPPFFARTLAASITARDQSIKPRPPSSSSTALCKRRHKPASVHTLNRRCAVGTVTPN